MANFWAPTFWASGFWAPGFWEADGVIVTPPVIPEIAPPLPTVEYPVAQVSWTKREFVEAAYEELGYASYAFSLQPEQMHGALIRLDSMMARWYGQGIRLAYPLPARPRRSELDSYTNVPDWANEAVYLNLAIRLASSIGKQVSQEMRMAAKDAYDVVLIKATENIPKVRMPGGLPMGAGNRGYGGYGTFSESPPVRIDPDLDDFE